MPLVLRSVKGSKLTISEMDGNFLYLQSLILSGNTSGSTQPAGSDSQVQYNDNGSFGASEAFFYDSAEHSLNVPTLSASTVFTTDADASGRVSAAFFSNPSTVTSSQTVPEEHNAVIFGPEITLAQGVSFTVSSGSVLTVVPSSTGGTMVY